MPLRLDGHEAWWEPTESGRRYRCGCSCGWRSQTRSTQLEATKTLVWHLGAEKRRADRLRAERRVAGLSTREVEGGGTVVAGT